MVFEKSKITLVQYSKRSSEFSNKIPQVAGFYVYNGRIGLSALLKTYSGAFSFAEATEGFYFSPLRYLNITKSTTYKVMHFVMAGRSTGC